MALRTVFSGRTLASVRSGLSSSVKSIGYRSLVTFSLPDLPYDYGALEPAISGEIMQLHHQKHHHTYVTNYNKGDAPALVKLQSAIKFNGGGHINYSIFSQNLTPVRVCLYLNHHWCYHGGPPGDQRAIGSINWYRCMGWEHAYYLQYKNVRPDYLKNIWKVINWKYAGKVYEKECP